MTAGGSENEEAFVGQADGQLEEGAQVLADLDGAAEEDDMSDDGEQEEAGDAEEDLEDDSIHTFEGHADGVYSVAWSPSQPDVVATGGADDRAYIWRVGQEAFEQTGGAVLELSGHSDTVSCLAFNAAGDSLASGGMDGRVKVWDVASGRCAQSLEGPGDAVEWMRWHPKGNVLLAGAADFTAWMWLAQTGACMQVFSGHSGPVSCGGFTPDGKAVVTGGGEGDASLRVWSPKTGECTLTVQGHPYHTAGLTCLDIHADSTAVITGSEDGVPKVVSLSHGRVVASLGGPGAAEVLGHLEDTSTEAVAFSRHLTNVAMSAGMDGRLVLWDLGAAVPSTRASCQHAEGVTRLAQHPTQPLVFTACMDGTVRCWDTRTGANVHTWHGCREPVQDLAVSPDGNYVLVGSEDNSARVFSMLAGGSSGGGA